MEQQNVMFETVECNCQYIYKRGAENPPWPVLLKVSTRDTCSSQSENKTFADQDFRCDVPVVELLNKTNHSA